MVGRFPLRRALVWCVGLVAPVLAFAAGDVPNDAMPPKMIVVRIPCGNHLLPCSGADEFLVRPRVPQAAGVTND